MCTAAYITFVHFRSWQEYGHRYKYGYVSHTNQRGLYKLSLPAMKYVKAIDLAPYNCVPRSLQYSSLCKFHSIAQCSGCFVCACWPIISPNVQHGNQYRSLFLSLFLSINH